VRGLEVLRGVCGQRDLLGGGKSHSLKAVGMGLEEQVLIKPALTGSRPGSSLLEDVCCKRLCPFPLILPFSGWLCQSA